MKLKKIKVTTQHPKWPLIRQTPGSSANWGNNQFFINQDIEECDAWVVFDGLLKEEKVVCPPDNTIFVTWEPPTIKKYTQEFLNQFSTVITCHKAIKHSNIIYQQQAHPWFVNKTYDELTTATHVKKDKMLSIITSDKIFTEGHRKRFGFCLNLKEYFGNKADLFGRGINQFEDKWDVLAPYKFTIAIENFSTEDWITEKLPDCFSAHTFPFYYGSPNVDKYFDSRSYISIDIENIDKSIKLIEKALENDYFYEERSKFIIDSKNKYLNELQFFPMISKVLEGKLGSTNKKLINVKPE